MTPGEETRLQMVCPTCRGTGRLQDEVCSTCKGTGAIPDPVKTAPRKGPSTLISFAMIAFVILGGFFFLWRFLSGNVVQVSVSQSIGNTNINNPGNQATPYPATPTLAPGGNITPGSGPTPTPADSATPLPTAIPSTAIPTATATLNPMGMLVVSPTTIHLSLCALGKSNFTIKNTGSGSLDWAASSNALYLFSAKSGTLGPSTEQEITVNNITLAGIITITANAPGSPQAIVITCGV